MRVCNGSCLLLPVFLVLSLSLLAGCRGVASVGAELGTRTGVLDARQAESLRQTGELAERSMEDFTPEQEYFIGRAVAARVLEDYAVLDDPAAQAYLNNLGGVLALHSERPSLYQGYSFRLLDSDELNAFATPGGHIFITRGMARLAQTEDELAAILAHEIAHVQERHGLQAIRSSRVTAALTSAALTGAQLAGDDDLRELTDIFEDSIDDITRTLFVNGYSREFEREADDGAVAILERTGYRPEALSRVLERMDDEWDPQGPGFARTHPSPSSRIAELGLEPADSRSEARAERFSRFRAAL
ncbi:peptidase M48-like protein [Thioalkalivibrio sp. ALE21]|uniref:M48 family metalloprotease n=1 Tax=Thioalkalivibrio sp. ALE21 TaxID=1158175 RepID=UPI000D843960|nr:M48 family metalloprotease [Thioalkalivibrio sp. ALE21]PYG03515.1 peptidase M48-like protein [Thioalkalivibrio sp. ALE21]